jgi:hypothetical protein
MINLIIKGNMFDAFNAAHARGIALISAAQLFNDKPNEVVASCADSALDAVRVWFMASDGPAPYPAGALLFYSDKQSAAFNDERAAPDAHIADNFASHYESSNMQAPDADEAYRVWEEACESEAIHERAAPEPVAKDMERRQLRRAGARKVRGRLIRDVERYPNFIAKAGLTGVLREDNGALYLTMDEPLAGAEEWDNSIQWLPEDGDNPWEDLEVI